MKKLLILLILLSFTVNAQNKKVSDKVKNIENKEMKTYFLVFLKKGPKRDQDSATAAEIQKGHLAHLTKMYNEGKLDLAGPILADIDLRGICVYNVATLEEAKRLSEEDPAVKSGRLLVEIIPWMSQKGATLK